MKFKITMKDPDGFSDSMQEAAKQSVSSATGIDDEEREQLEDTCKEELEQVARKWFRYSEYVTIEIDTDAKTATVCPS
jgi:hypothetical protein